MRNQRANGSSSLPLYLTAHCSCVLHISFPVRKCISPDDIFAIGAAWRVTVLDTAATRFRFRADVISMGPQTGSDRAELQFFRVSYSSVCGSAAIGYVVAAAAEGDTAVESVRVSLQ